MKPDNPVLSAFAPEPVAIGMTIMVIVSGILLVLLWVHLMYKLYVSEIGDFTEEAFAPEKPRPPLQLVGFWLIVTIVFAYGVYKLYW